MSKEKEIRMTEVFEWGNNGDPMRITIVSDESHENIKAYDDNGSEVEMDETMMEEAKEALKDFVFAKNKDEKLW